MENNYSWSIKQAEYEAFKCGFNDRSKNPDVNFWANNPECTSEVRGWGYAQFEDFCNLPFEERNFSVMTVYFESKCKQLVLDIFDLKYPLGEWYPYEFKLDLLSGVNNFAKCNYIVKFVKKTPLSW